MVPSFRKSNHCSPGLYISLPMRPPLLLITSMLPLILLIILVLLPVDPALGTCGLLDPDVPGLEEPEDPEVPGLEVPVAPEAPGVSPSVPLSGLALPLVAP